MYADCSAPVASGPNCRTWPPAPAPRESIVVERDPDGDTSTPANAIPFPARHKPTRVRTYITAAGVVRIADPAPAAPPRATGPALPDRTDAPPMRHWAEEV